MGDDEESGEELVSAGEEERGESIGRGVGDGGASRERRKEMSEGVDHCRSSAGGRKVSTGERERERKEKETAHRIRELKVSPPSQSTSTPSTPPP